MQRRIIIENRRRPGIFLLGVFYAISQEIEYSRRKSNIIPRLRQMHQDGEFLYLTNPRWFTFWFRQFRLFSQSSDDAAPHRYRAVITISNYENLSGTFSQTSQIHSFSLEYFSIYVENSRNLIELVGEKKNFACTIFLRRMHWLTNDGVHPTAVAAAMQTLRIGNRTSHFSPSFLRPTRACKIEYQRCEKKKSILMLPAVVASSSSGDMQTIAGRWYVRLHQRKMKRLLHENA